MEKFDIEASFRRIDNKLADDLSEEDKIKAIKQFRKLYAEEMSKLTLEIEKRQKVQENINTINQKEKSGARKIDDSLRKRMAKHNLNRDKQKESKQKEYKLMQENWRRRYQEILRKNKIKERDAYHKAEKMRKDIQIFWSKKNQTVQLRDDELSDRKSETVKPSYSRARSQYRKPAETQYDLYQNDNKIKVNFPNIRRNDLDNSKFLNRSIGESTINDEIKFHQEKSLKEGKDVEEEKIKNLMERLEKIQKTRKVAKEKKEQHIMEAKKVREYRENPEVLEANRKKSLAQYKKPKLRKSEGSRHDLSSSPSKSNVNLSNSIIAHLQSKKRIKQIEFLERQHAYEEKKSKIKQTQINRLVRDTINMLKHQALSDVNE